MFKRNLKVKTEISTTLCRLLPGKWNCVLYFFGETWAGEGDVIVPEEVITRAGDEGVEELQEEVLDPESSIITPGKLGIELLGFRFMSSIWIPKIFGLVVRRCGAGESPTKKY